MMRACEEDASPVPVPVPPPDLDPGQNNICFAAVLRYCKPSSVECCSTGRWNYGQVGCCCCGEVEDGSPGQKLFPICLRHVGLSLFPSCTAAAAGRSPMAFECRCHVTFVYRSRLDAYPGYCCCNSYRLGNGCCSGCYGNCYRLGKDC